MFYDLFFVGEDFFMWLGFPRMDICKGVGWGETVDLFSITGMCYFFIIAIALSYYYISTHGSSLSFSLRFLLFSISFPNSFE